MPRDDPIYIANGAYLAYALMMCGIVGMVSLRSKVVDEQVLRPMMNRIAYRGPDDRGTWAHGPHALGHLRLSILDLSERGHQPFVTSDGQGVLTYNGEVYNYVELRQELEKEGASFRSTTDTEVVLEALHRWGPERAIPMFNGMFGLAYLDRRSDTLWLSRDRLGIKPVYVARTSTSIVFASEIKALLVHPDVRTEPDRHALTVQMILHRLDRTVTPFAGIESVQPGAWLRIQGDRVEEHVYFDAVDRLDLGRIVGASDGNPAQMVSAFGEAMLESVRIHLASDAPLATACSGGVDSSLITALTRTHRSDVMAYVADVKGAISEGEKADRVAKHLGVNLRVVDVSAESYVRQWPAATWFGDQPSTHPNDIPLLAVARACQADGIKVLVTGEGADELFGGYDWQRRTLRRWWQHGHRERIGLYNDNRLFRLFARLMNWAPPSPDNPLYQFWQDPAGLITSLNVPLDAERMVRGSLLYRRLEGAGPPKERAFLAHCIDDLYGHLESLLRRNDRMGMAASLETRVPFLENHLIDMGMHAPFRAKFHDNEGKWVVKEFADQHLPSDIVYAQKIGFAFDDRNALYGLPLLRGGVAAEIFHWTPSTTNMLIEMLPNQLKSVWTAVSIELWGRLFLRGEDPEELGELLAKNRRDAAVA